MSRPAAETIFEEMKRFLRFGPEDERLLRQLAPHARPRFREISDSFYQRLAEHENARRVFSGPEQVERLKQSLCGWLETLLSGPWNEEFFQARVRVGRVHVAVGVPQHYVCGAMDLVRARLSEVAAAAFTDGEPGFRAVADALDKVLDLDLTINLHAYAEAQSEQVRELQQQRMDALRTLTAGLAHEVRNPLNAAHLQLTIARKRLTDPAPDLSDATAAVSAADGELLRLAALVNEFLEYASPTPLQRQPHDLRAIVEAVVAAHSAQAASNGTQIVLHAGEPTSLPLDAGKMERVVRNLVSNALEATGSGGQVVLRVLTEGDQVVLEVQDDGPGLSAAVARLIEPFFTTKNLGTGLGLSLVHRIVADHGGEITAFRRDGRTVFTVRLPRAMAR